MALQLRRGTNAERLAMTPMPGELIFVTDHATALVPALWVGDLIGTPGGIVAATQSLNDLSDVVITSRTAGDLLTYDGTQWINNNVIATATANNRLVAEYVNASNASSFAMYLRKNYGPTNYTNNDGVGLAFELKSDSQGEDEIASITAINTSGGITLNFSTTLDDGANYVTPLTLNTNGSTFRSDVNITTEALRINSDNSAANGTIYFNGTNGAIAYNRSTNFFDFNNNIARGDTYISSNTIATGTGALNLNTPSGQPVNVQRDLVVGGNLTVNGTTTTVNSTTLTVDDKNIELAATGSPSDTTADGGGITLKGFTDKKIFWDNATDRWYFDNGDGVNSVFVRNLTDINNVETTSFTRGDMFYYDGTNWVNDNVVQFGSTSNRPTFESDTGVYGRSQSALVTSTNTGANNYTDADGAGMLMRLVSDGQEPVLFGSISTILRENGNHQIRLSTSVNNFNFILATSIINNSTLVFPTAHGLSAGDRIFYGGKSTNGLALYGTYYVASDSLTTTQCKLTNVQYSGTIVTLINGTGLNLYFSKGTEKLLAIDQTAAYIAPSNLILNAFNTGVGGNDAQITVERGTSGTGDAYIKWDESDTQWFINNQTQVDGRLSVIGDLFTEGGGHLYLDGTNIVLNNANPAASATIQVSRPDGTVAIRWNESIDRWETTTNGSGYIPLPNQQLDTGSSVTFGGVKAGNVQVGWTGDNEIDTSTGGLTIDSASGTVTVDDNLIVTENLTVNGNTTLGTGAIDTVNINCGEVNIGITSADVAVVIGNAASDSLTVNANSIFNNNVTLGSSGGDILTVNSQVTGSILFNDNATTTNRGVMGTVSGNDYWFVGGAATTSNNTGYMVIATGDDGTEPIYVRQYNNGSPLTGTTFRELTLLNGSGDTALPGQLRINGNTIRSSSDTTAITLSNANVTVAGALFVVGNEIFSSGGNRNLTFSGTDVIVENNLTVAGNAIKSNGGTTAISLSGANVTVAGNLTVNGTTTTINSTTLDVDDKNITIAKGAANAAAADGGGITLEGPTTAATILYEADDDSWNLNKKTTAPQLQVDNININGNTISSTDPNGNVILDPAGTGIVSVVGDIDATAKVTSLEASANAYFIKDLAGVEVGALTARTVTTTSTNIVTLTVTTRLAMKAMIVVGSGTDIHTVEAMIMRDPGEPSGAQITLYGELKTGAALATFTADYANSELRLRATPTSATSTTFKLVRTSLF